MSNSVKFDIYKPSIDDKGNYRDNIPMIDRGIYCPCGSRKDKIYDNIYKFTTHTKSYTHQNWILTLNKCKDEYSTFIQKKNKIIKNQNKKIEELEIQIKEYLLTINNLTEQLTEINNRKGLKID